MILNEAADRFEFLTPFRNIKPLKIQRPDIEPFTFEEVNLILNTVRADFNPYYTTRFFTGMRTGEIHGLKWRFVDFKKKEILVRECQVRGRTEYTKNDGSQREIHMSQPVIDALQAQYKVTGNSSEYVFINAAGLPFNSNNVSNRVWHPLLRFLGLRKRTAYQTRHTAATLWLASGEAPEWIARQMGHSNTEMLFRVYSRYVPNLTRQDGSAFERLLLQQIEGK
jgi:integrase